MLPCEEASNAPLTGVLNLNHRLILISLVIEGLRDDGMVTSEAEPPGNANAVVFVDGRGVSMTTPDPDEPTRRRSVKDVGREGAETDLISHTT